MSRPAAVRSWEDHVEVWRRLGREVDGAAWGRAEIAASLKGQYGEDAVGRFAEEVGFSQQSIWKFAATFEAFRENSQRCENLSFSHHLIAATLSENPKAAVELAEREGWSANVLRAHLRPAPQLEPDGEACETADGTCGPVTPKDRMMHVSLLIHGFNKLRDYDPGPLVELGTKKDLRALATQIGDAIAWLESFQTAIKGRL